jgi:histidine triad (HIT) family protein
MVAESCLFCGIANGKVPADIVAETDDCIAFRDIKPSAPVHVLVIPREHVSSLNEADDPSMIGKLALLAAQIARSEGISESGYRAVINTNEQAGQTVFHVHLHLLGGKRLGAMSGG